MKYLVTDIWRILKYFPRNIFESPHFLEFRSVNYFGISDSRISSKLKRHSNDIFSLIILILGWSLHFSIATSTPSLDLECAFTSELASHSFIPNFPNAVLKSLLRICANSKSSEKTFLLLTRVIAEGWIHLLLWRGFIVFQNILFSVI